MELPQRKSTRLEGYDYSQQNYYFVTVCTNEKKCLFGKAETRNLYGQIAEKCMHEISGIYNGIHVDNFVVMPNHVHAIIVIDKKAENTLTHVVGQYKMSVTKKIRKRENNIKVWQRSFHDHIIRNQQDYERIWKYIQANPQNWSKDCFYIEFEE